MRPFLISLVIGVAVGIAYGLLKVRSPAPPAIALLGLLGMLAGEQIVPIVKSYLFKSETRVVPTPSEHVEGDAGHDRDSGLKP
jgi:XapX domain-containing protein